MDAKDELEKLLSEARAQARTQTRQPQKPARLAFSNPESWTYRGQVQLVHKEEKSPSIETLVGIFDETVHPSGARRLVAAQLLPDVKPRIEYVTGDHWIGENLEAKHKPIIQTIEVCEDLVLDCGPVATATLVACKLVGGGISRVCLMQPTVFQSNVPRTILALPAEMDILEGLTRGTKERIWREVKRQLGVEE